MTAKLREVAERMGVPVQGMVREVVVVFENNAFSFEIVTAVNVGDGTHTVRNVLEEEERVIENDKDRYY